MKVSSVNSVSFGSEKSGGMGNVISAMGKSALNVGVTAGAGAAVGAGVGKLVTLVPYKPTADALRHQYTGMLGSAIISGETPSYAGEAGGKLASIIQKGKELFKIGGYAEKNYGIYQTCSGVIQDATDEAIKDGVFQKSIKKIIKGKMPEGGFSREQMLERLSKKMDRTREFLKTTSKNMNKVTEEFIETAGSSEKAKELAEKGAKHLRNKTIVGASIAVGVLSAFVINILKTYGVLKFPKIGAKVQQNQGMQLSKLMPGNSLTDRNTTQGRG